jgi:CRISPR-associated endonuclease Csn1
MKKLKKPMIYRLGLDLGATSIGWAIVRLNQPKVAETAQAHEAVAQGKLKPSSIVTMGVRLFPDGRTDKDKTSLAVARRLARGARRRRDRVIARKNRLLDALMVAGFMPSIAETEARRELVDMNPYEIRARALNEAVHPHEIGRAIFHMAVRRGFKSNRKSDKSNTDTGNLKQAIFKTRQAIADLGMRTLGEWLAAKYELHAKGEFLRNRDIKADNAKPNAKKEYRLYIDRQMIEDEFDLIWATQAGFAPAVYTAELGHKLKDVLLFQRPLKSKKGEVGRCTLEPEEPRAALALPSVQQFRIYQELNHLRIKGSARINEADRALTLAERDALAAMLEKTDKLSLTALKKALGLSSAAELSIESSRKELRGNATSIKLASPACFGAAWHGLDLAVQDALVNAMIEAQDDAALLAELREGWPQLMQGLSAEQEQAVVDAVLPDGYGKLSSKALATVLPALKSDVMTYDKAVLAGGYDHHSQVGGVYETGEVNMPELPYYGQPLRRHVSFGTGKVGDADEIRYGKIGNPTVHIGLNQLRKVVNAIIKKYGNPTEIVVEVARDLKLSQKKIDELNKENRENEKKNEAYRQEIVGAGLTPSSHYLQKVRLWHALSATPANRKCVFTGRAMALHDVLSNATEIEHLLPYSRTLDDTRANKTICFVEANRIKGDRSPWEAFGERKVAGYDWADILARAANFANKRTRDRFAEDAMAKFNDENEFLARALNDTAYLSKMAKEYLMCVVPKPENVRVIPGQMTEKIRRALGLNQVLVDLGDEARKLAAAQGATLEEGEDGEGANLAANLESDTNAEPADDKAEAAPETEAEKARKGEVAAEKNRNDHRHHAIDALVVALTDQGLLASFQRESKYQQHYAQKSVVARKMRPPFPEVDKHGVMLNDAECRQAFRARVKEKVAQITVSHKRDHGYQGQMMEETSWSPKDKRGNVAIAFSPKKGNRFKTHDRQRLDESGQPLAFKKYVGGSNYAIEITATLDKKGQPKWEGTVLSTYDAYKIVQKGRAAGLSLAEAEKGLRHPTLAQNGQPLVMRLMINDVVAMNTASGRCLYRVVKMASTGTISFTPLHEANVNARDIARNNYNKDLKAGKDVSGLDPSLHIAYVFKTASSLQKAGARVVSVSPIGDVQYLKG